MKKRDDEHGIQISWALGEMLKENPQYAERAVERIENFKELFARIDGSILSAKVLHATVDETIKIDLRNMKKHLNRTVSCKKNCTACCYQNVDIFDTEADLLAAAIKGGQPYNKKEFKKQKSMAHADFKKNPRPCIFLKDKECSIYNFRPIVCRKYHVVGPPSQCKVEPGKSALVASPPMFESEVVYTAYSQLRPLEDNSGMASMLAKRGVGK